MLSCRDDYRVKVNHRDEYIGQTLFLRKSSYNIFIYLLRHKAATILTRMFAQRFQTSFANSEI